MAEDEDEEEDRGGEDGAKREAKENGSDEVRAVLLKAPTFAAAKRVREATVVLFDRWENASGE